MMMTLHLASLDSSEISQTPMMGADKEPGDAGMIVKGVCKSRSETKKAMEDAKNGQ
jgi:hypothetical protein